MAPVRPEDLLSVVLLCAVDGEELRQIVGRHAAGDKPDGPVGKKHVEPVALHALDDRLGHPIDAQVAGFHPMAIPVGDLHGENRIRVEVRKPAGAIPVEGRPGPRDGHDVVAKMLELAAVDKRDVLYDLGCGDGRIVIAAAKRFGCRAAGFDIDPIRVEESRENVRKGNVGDLVRIEQQDIFKLDLRPASVVTLYLNPRFNARLVPQLEKLKPGSRIVSHEFGIQGVKPDKVVRVASEEDGRKHTIYLWTTPLRKRQSRRSERAGARW